MDGGPHLGIGCRKFSDQGPRKAEHVDVIVKLEPLEHPGEAHGRQRLSGTADHRAAPEDALGGEDFREPFGGYPVRANDIAHQTAIWSVHQTVALLTRDLG